MPRNDTKKGVPIKRKMERVRTVEADDDAWADAYAAKLDEVKTKIAELIEDYPLSVGHISRVLPDEQHYIWAAIHSMDGDGYTVEKKGMITRISRGTERRYINDSTMANSHLFGKPDGIFADYK